jgi:hypothetical protein
VADEADFFVFNPDKVRNDYHVHGFVVVCHAGKLCHAGQFKCLLFVGKEKGE